MKQDDIKAVAIVTSIHMDFDARIWKHARALAEAGVAVHLVCPWQVDGEHERPGINFHTFRRVQRRALRPLLIPWRVFGALRRCIGRVSIVHFHDIDLLPWMSMLSLFKPVVYDIHENYPEEMMVRDWVPDWARPLMFHGVRSAQWLLASVVRNLVLVADSQEADLPKRHVRKIYVRNYATVALEEKVVQNHASRPDAVVFTGAHHVSNGSLLLLDIAQRLSRRRPGVPFYVTSRFASEDFRARFLAEVDRRALTDIVQVLPYVRPDEIMSVLGKATIAITPNLRVTQQINGVHTKLFEYMAAGLPIVASDLPHQVKVVGEEGVGLLAKPEDPESFVKCIEELLDDREKAGRLGRRGREVFREKYSWESQMPRLREFYKAILAGD